jgi:hypothetical protein
MASKQMNGGLVRGLKSFIVTSIRDLAFTTILTKVKRVRP